MNPYLEVGDEVAAAIAAGKPIVALESTSISHGMPWPANVDTVIKASRRDLPRLVSCGLDGATTVSATMIIAAMAGIGVFATGGIGGVHRGAETSWDVSADLEELAHTQVAVVCAGAKAILDLPKTLEFLETRGVPVIGFGTDELPAFYTTHSGLRLEEREDDPAGIARRMIATWGLGFTSGLVVANPVPPSMSMDPAIIEAAIEDALRAAASARVKGKEVTPFLLAKIKELTNGESLKSNIALVLNNAVLGARIAAAYVALAVSPLCLPLGPGRAGAC